MKREEKGKKTEGIFPDAYVLPLFLTIFFLFLRTLETRICIRMRPPFPFFFCAADEAEAGAEAVAVAAVAALRTQTETQTHAFTDSLTRFLTHRRGADPEDDAAENESGCGRRVPLEGCDAELAHGLKEESAARAHVATSALSLQPRFSLTNSSY